MTEDPISRALMKVLNSNTEPRVVVLVAHGLVELMINTLIDSRCKNAKRITEDSRSFSHSSKLIILNEMGVLHEIYFEVLDRFRRLRNDAAHKAFFEVDDSRIRFIAEPFERGGKIPEGCTGFSDSLGVLCASIIQGLWNSYQDELGPVFAPNLHSHTKEKSCRVGTAHLP